MTEKVKYKQIQIINFFASKNAKKEITLMKLFKLTWLADKLHLLSHGDFFSGDSYCVMKFGIVPSGMKDLAKQPNGHALFSYDGEYTLTANSELDKSVFSETEIEVMDRVWDKFGKKSDFFLSDLSHEYPEYLRYKEQIESDGGSYWVKMEDFFSLPSHTQKSMSNFFDFEDEYLQFMLEDYLERKELDEALEEHHRMTERKYLQSMN